MQQKQRRTLPLPPGLTHIGGHAFRDCSGLTEITLPPGLTHIREYAFRDCSGLTEITLPAGLTNINIREQAFWNCSNIAAVLVTPDPTFRGIPPVLETKAVLSLRVDGAAPWGWAPCTLATLRGDVVQVRLHTASRQSRAAFDVAAAISAAAAAELGVLPEDIFVVDGKVILYRPTVTVSVVVLDAAGARTDAAAAPIPVHLATECGPTDKVDTVAPTTVSYAVRKVAQAVFGIPGTEAGAAVRLHVHDGAVAGLGQDFRKLGGRDQGAVLAAAGIVDGAVLGVKARRRGWLRREVELKIIAS